MLFILELELVLDQVRFFANFCKIYFNLGKTPNDKNIVSSVYLYMGKDKQQTSNDGLNVVKIKIHSDPDNNDGHKEPSAPKYQSKRMSRFNYLDKRKKAPIPKRLMDIERQNTARRVALFKESSNNRCFKAKVFASKFS